VTLPRPDTTATGPAHPRRLGRSGLEVSGIGFGAWALGGQWGEAPLEDSAAAIRHAWDAGVNWIDTAPVYGAGQSERAIGRALRGMTERPYVFSKCGFDLADGGSAVSNLKADAVRRQLEGSLERLGLDELDVYQIHWREPDEDIEEAWATLAALKAEGKVRHIGVSNLDVAQMERCQAIAPIETVQPPYSMLIRLPETWRTPFVDNTPPETIEPEILPYCLRHDIGVLVYSPMASGMLSGRMTRERLAALPADDWRRDDPDFTPPSSDRAIALVDRLRPFAAARGWSVGQLAIAWALDNPAVHTALVGLRHPQQVDELLPAAGIELSASDREELDAILGSA
jgi:aryl-alcohol dehydrogenase-like predicted oxidoreductase